MRKDITEPKHWRSNDQRNPSWSSRRRSPDRLELAADVVDAALAEVATELPDDEAAIDTSVLTSLTDLSQQLVQLQQQHQQLQKLLDQAQPAK